MRKKGSRARWLGGAGLLVVSASFQGAVVAETKSSPEQARWTFSSFKPESGGTFGIIPSEGAGEFQIFFGSCDPKKIEVEIDFGNKALAELIRADAYPIVRFLTDGEKTDVSVDRLNFNEGPTGGPWNALINGVDKQLIQK